jgi:hypothetical protein
MGYEGSQKDRENEVNTQRKRAERLRLFLKKMVEGMLVCSSTGGKRGNLENRKWFKRAVRRQKAA